MQSMDATKITQVEIKMMMAERMVFGAVAWTVLTSANHSHKAEDSKSVNLESKKKWISLLTVADIEGKMIKLKNQNSKLWKAFNAVKVKPSYK